MKGKDKSYSENPTDKQTGLMKTTWISELGPWSRSPRQPRCLFISALFNQFKTKVLPKSVVLGMWENKIRLVWTFLTSASGAQVIYIFYNFSRDCVLWKKHMILKRLIRSCRVWAGKHVASTPSWPPPRPKRNKLIEYSWTLLFRTFRGNKKWFEIAASK